VNAAAQTKSAAGGAELSLGGIHGYFNLFKRITPYVLPLWDKLFLRVVITQANAFMAVFGVIAVQRAVDDGLRQHNASAFFLWAGTGACLGLLHLVFMWIYATMVMYVIMRVDLNLKRKIFNHVQSMALRFHQSRPIGENMYRINSDTTASGDLVGNSLPEIIERFFSIGTTVTLVLVLRPFVLMLIMVQFFLFFFYSQFVVTYMYRFQALLRRSQQNVTAMLQEILNAFPISKALSRQRHDIRRYFGRLADQARATVAFFVSESFWFQGMEPAGLLYLWWLAIAYYGVCGYFVIKGYLTVGEWISLLALILAVYVPMRQLIWSVQRLRVSAVAVQRIFQTLDLEPEIQDLPGSTKLDTTRGEIEFSHVYFRYHPDGPDVLKDLSFKVEPGKKLAIVGVSGAGKTTIFNLLIRLCDPTKGSILVDGRDLRTVELESYLDTVGVVLQDTFLFSASVRDNILVGDIHASEERLNDAIERAGLSSTVAALPEGLDTVLLEGGNLSMGQKQRIAIARALVRNPKILLLDEATSLLDPVTEERILRQLAEIETGRTRLVIAHNISSVQDADEILVMDQGVCVQRGRHRDLLSEDGPYRRLWLAEKEKHIEDEDCAGEGDITA